jgi:hypothetical protein
MGLVHIHRPRNQIYHQNLPPYVIQCGLHQKHNPTTLVCPPPPSRSHNKYDRSGVYQLTCPDCSMKYIGQTDRPFSVRYKEHYREYTHDNPKSKFSEHLLQAHHSIGPMHTIMEPLYYTTKWRLLNTIEKFHIYRETQLDNQLNYRHTVQTNAIFDTLTRIHTSGGHSHPP